MKVYMETLGCPKNFNDTQTAKGIMTAEGITITDDAENSDVMILNTCGFINDAKRESIQRIFELAELKDENRKLVVSGCLAQRYADELFEEMPEVDCFVGVNQYPELPKILRELCCDEKRIKSISLCCDTSLGILPRVLEENPYTATLKIAEGCNNRCAYCVIPDIRGPYRSKKKEDILKEAQWLADKGCKELILIAQDVTLYGTDIYGRQVLPELLKELCGIEGIEWIRLMYCYEDKITDELIQVMASEEKICNYIDIPLQHVSDKVLAEMNHHSTSASIADTVSRLRNAIPDIHIRTTLIAGFPGETEDDFEAVLDFVEKQRLERLGVFAYSREEGTAAGDREDQIDEDVKAARADSVMRMQLEISREINEAQVGNTIMVLVESVDEEGAYIGRTQYDAPEIDNTVIFRSDRKLMPGDFVKVNITDAFDYDLVGRMEE